METYIWLVHVFIGLTFMLLLVASFLRYRARRRGLHEAKHHRLMRLKLMRAMNNQSSHTKHMLLEELWRAAPEGQSAAQEMELDAGMTKPTPRPSTSSATGGQTPQTNSAQTTWTRPGTSLTLLFTRLQQQRKVGINSMSDQPGDNNNRSPVMDTEIEYWSNDNATRSPVLDKEYWSASDLC